MIRFPCNEAISQRLEHLSTLQTLSSIHVPYSVPGCVDNSDKNRSNSVPISSLVKLRAIAAGTPAVCNGLLRPEHVAYMMGWRYVVNPLSRSITVAYSACGPDIATPLFTTNPAHVIGVEFVPPQRDVLERCIDAWDTIDSDPKAVPHTCDYLTDERLSDSFAEDLVDRRQDCFWGSGMMTDWSLERLLTIELKKMGVDRQSIAIESAKHHMSLQFPWAYPGEALKLRRFTYPYLQPGQTMLSANKGGAIVDFIKCHPYIFKRGPIDVFYEKSCDTHTVTSQSGYSRESLADYLMAAVGPHLSKNGWILMGDQSGPEDELELREHEFYAILGNGWVRHDLALRFEVMMRRAMASNRGIRGSEVVSYGWRLFGARKR